MIQPLTFQHLSQVTGGASGDVAMETLTLSAESIELTQIGRVVDQVVKTPPPPAPFMPSGI